MDTQPRLIGLGLALVVVGIVVMALTLMGQAWADPAATEPVGQAIPADRAASDGPSLIWPIVGGVMLAAGAALVGLGMNRWRGSKKKRLGSLRA
jgi:hypothetical protein